MLKDIPVKINIRRCRTTIPYQDLQKYFEYSSLGYSDNRDNLADNRGKCPRFWSALTPGISSLD